MADEVTSKKKKKRMCTPSHPVRSSRRGVVRVPLYDVDARMVSGDRIGRERTHHGCVWMIGYMDGWYTWHHHHSHAPHTPTLNANTHFPTHKQRTTTKNKNVFRRSSSHLTHTPISSRLASPRFEHKHKLKLTRCVVGWAWERARAGEASSNDPPVSPLTLSPIHTRGATCTTNVYRVW